MQRPVIRWPVVVMIVLMIISSGHPTANADTLIGVGWSTGCYHYKHDDKHLTKLALLNNAQRSLDNVLGWM